MTKEMSATPASKLPGLKPRPFMGGQMNLLRFFSNPIKILQTIYHQHGLIGAITAGDPSFVCAFGPTYNQQFLPDAKNFYHAVEVPFKLPPDSAAEHFNHNLTVMNGDLHRQQRRLMMPAFHKNMVDAYRDDMVAVIDSYLTDWPTAGQLNIAAEAVNITLSVMMRCLFGVEVKEDAAQLGQMSKDFLGYIISPKVMFFPFNLPGTAYRGFLEVAEGLETRLLEIIQQRRSESEPGRDILSTLIHANAEDGSKLSDIELIGQAGLLFTAGHETTAFSLAWTLFLLTQHPQVYADLTDELTAKLNGEAPTVEQLADLPLLDSVVKESMRLLPATPFLFIRRGLSDFQLGPYHMPQDSKVILSSLITHRLPDLYPNPLRFQPERWFNFKPSIFEYVPFGAGPRMCLGAGFASLELRLAVAMIVQRFRLTLHENTRVSHQMHGITMGPKYGLPMDVFTQDRNFTRTQSVLGDIHGLVDLA